MKEARKMGVGLFPYFSDGWLRLVYRAIYLSIPILHLMMSGLSAQGTSRETAFESEESILALSADWLFHQGMSKEDAQKVSRRNFQFWEHPFLGQHLFLVLADEVGCAENICRFHIFVQTGKYIVYHASISQVGSIPPAVNSGGMGDSVPKTCSIQIKYWCVLVGEMD